MCRKRRVVAVLADAYDDAPEFIGIPSACSAWSRVVPPKAMNTTAEMDATMQTMPTTRVIWGHFRHFMVDRAGRGRGTGSV